MPFVEEIIIEYRQYEHIHNEDGTDTLKRYNVKTKMWVENVYNPKSTDNPFKDPYIIDIFANTYIEKVLGIKTE